MAAIPYLLDLSLDTEPKCLGSGNATRLMGLEFAFLLLPSTLGQVHLSNPKFLGSGRGCQTQVNNNNNNNNN